MKRRITAGVLVACMAVSMAGCSAGGSGDAKSADTEAAQRVYLSPSYLSRIFKEKNGEGFAELLLRTRMEKACEMLEDCKYRSYDIAFYLGYDNPKSFSRASALPI